MATSFVPGMTDEAAVAGTSVRGVADEAVATAAASSVLCVAAVAVVGEMVHFPNLSEAFRFRLQLAGAVVVFPRQH